MQDSILGFEIEVVPPTGTGPISSLPQYILRGPKGAIYGLARDVNHPHELSPINLRSRAGKPCGIKGYTRFSDANGKLAILDLVDED